MSSNGWIKLHRKIRENEIWKREFFDKRSAWIDLLLRAAHKEEKFLIGNTIIKLKPGEIFTSEKKLAKDWKWSRHKVRNFLTLLAQTDQIGTPKRTSRYTLLSIVNWKKYQSDNSEKDTKKNNEGTSKGHQRDTYKNVKNDKNVKDKPNTCVAGNSSATREVFNYWIEKLGHTKSKFSRDRKGKISARLKEGFSVDELKRAIDGCATSSYHMGDNDNGKVYDNINLIFRNAEKVESFTQYLEKAKKESPLAKRLRELKEKNE